MNWIATLGPFEVLEPVSRGAFGRVFKGRNAATGAAVALKVLDVAGAASFGPELEALTRLQHPHIVAPLEYGTVSPAAADRLEVRTGAPWLAMTWVGGGDLLKVRAELPTVRRWTEDLLDALAHAHAHGVLHLDLKPPNVLLRPSGTATLTDFGIAALVEDHGTHRAGTPGFMPPEQIRGATLSPASDLYALGCTVWALLLGRPPFGELAATERLRAHLTQRIEPPADLPLAVATWLDRCLAPDPQRRFHTASQARDALWDVDLAFGGDGSEPLSTPTMVPPTTPDTYRFDDDGPVTATLSPVATRGHLPHRAPIDAIQAMLTLRSRRLCLDGAPRSLLDRIQLPLLGRDREAGILWSIAQRVVDERKPQGIAIAGPPGVGKTQLVDWIRTTLAEHGAAQGSTLPRQVDELTVVTCPSAHGLGVLLHRCAGPLLLVVEGACAGLPSLALGPMEREPLVVLARGLTGVDESEGNALAEASGGMPGKLMELVREGPPWPETPRTSDAPDDALRARLATEPAAVFQALWPELLRPQRELHRMFSATSIAAAALEALGIGLEDPRALLVHGRLAHCWQLDAQNDRVDALEAALEELGTTQHQAWLWYVRGVRKRVGAARGLPRAEARTGLVLAKRAGDRIAEANLLALLLSSGSAADNHVYEQAVAVNREVVGSEAWTPALTQMELERCLRIGSVERARQLGERLLAAGDEAHQYTLATLAMQQGDREAARRYATASRDAHAARGILSVLGDELLLAHLDAAENTLTVRAIQELADRIDTCFGGPSAFGTEALALLLEQLLLRGENTLAGRVRNELAKFVGRPTEASEAVITRVREHLAR